jgi:hypothetical protein
MLTRIVLQLGVCALACMASLVPASSREPSHSDVSILCIPGPEAAALLRAFGKSTFDRGALAETVSVSATATDYEMRVGTVRAVIPRSWPAPGEKRRLACDYHATVIKDLNITSTFPETYLQALGAALVYRSTHPYPNVTANMEDATTDVLLTAVVSAVDIGISEGAPPSNLACRTESYRVDIPSFIVRPFDGCAEGHTPTGLPRPETLPPPNTPLPPS